MSLITWAVTMSRADMDRIRKVRKYLRDGIEVFEIYYKSGRIKICYSETPRTIEEYMHEANEAYNITDRYHGNSTVYKMV